MNVIGFDTETRGLRWADGETAFLGQWATDGAEWVAPENDPARVAEYLSALAGADVLVAHNFNFDAHQTRVTWGFDVDQPGIEWHDTDLMSRILFPEGQRKDRGGHGLKNLATVYLRADAAQYEDALKTHAKLIHPQATLNTPGIYYEIWRAYPEVLEKYGAMDARFTLDLYHNFMPRFEQYPELWKLYELERKVQRILYRAERAGTRVDPEAVARLKAYYLELLADASAKLEGFIGFLPEGDGSQEQLADALIGLGVPLTETTSSGRPAVNQQVLKPYERDYPVIGALFEWRRIKKFLSTYIGPTEGRETVHPSFMQCEAWTGRMSCRSPNMQNIPKRRDLSEDLDLKVRSIFVPRDGYAFVVADYSGIEDRLLAWFCGVEEGRRMIREGRDNHAYTASVVHPEFDEDYYAKGAPGQPVRDRIKHARYAITYGAGAPRVMHTINSMLPPDAEPIDKAEAKRITAKIKDSIPGYHALAGYNGAVRKQVEAHGFVRTIMGRRQIVGRDKSYVGLNALIQGSAADIMKQGLVNVAEAIEAEGLDAIPLLVVHDELVVECRIDQAERCAEIVQAGLESAYELDPPLVAEPTITEVSYGHAK